jgi:hypothetical protein
MGLNPPPAPAAQDSESQPLATDRDSRAGSRPLSGAWRCSESGFKLAGGGEPEHRWRLAEAAWADESDSDAAAAVTVSDARGQARARAFAAEWQPWWGAVWPPCDSDIPTGLLETQYRARNQAVPHAARRCAAAPDAVNPPFVASPGRTASRSSVSLRDETVL